jgi:ParB family chromosome partitioning protein
MGEEEIAAAFFVSVVVVKQRLRLAAVSPALLDVYAEDGITLDQLMAFTVNPDHARQEQVWEALQRHYSKQPYEIRRMLTEGAVRASTSGRSSSASTLMSRRGRGAERPVPVGRRRLAAGRGLLDMLVAEKLREAADEVAAEGFKWVETFVDLPYAHLYGLRRLSGEQAPLSPEQEAARDALQAEAERIEAEFAEAEEFSDEADQRMGEIETALEELENRPLVFDPAEVAIAGAFVSLGSDGRLRIDRGYVRPADEPPLPQPEPSPEVSETDAQAVEHIAASDGGGATVVSEPAPAPEPEEDEGMRPIPDRLLAELTAHRTVALRDALGNDPHVAFLACLHALVLRRFYSYALDSCVEIEAKSVGFAHQAPGLADTASAKSVDRRHEAWAAALPKEPEALWDKLVGFDHDTRQHLFAHCVAMSVNATYDAYNRRPRALAHADRLAAAVDLDMAGVGWSPTVDNFLGRVTKARIVAAVREARGERQAQAIDHLRRAKWPSGRKAFSPARAGCPSRCARRVASCPARSRRRPIVVPDAVIETGDEPSGEETAVDGGEPAMGEDDDLADDEHVAEADAPYAYAAE